MKNRTSKEWKTNKQIRVWEERKEKRWEWMKNRQTSQECEKIEKSEPSLRGRINKQNKKTVVRG